MSDISAGYVVRLFRDPRLFKQMGNQTGVNIYFNKLKMTQKIQ